MCLEGAVAQERQAAVLGEEEDGILIAPDLADEAFAGLDGVEAEVALEGLGVVLDLLENLRGHFMRGGQLLEMKRATRPRPSRLTV